MQTILTLRNFYMNLAPLITTNAEREDTGPHEPMVSLAKEVHGAQ